MDTHAQPLRETDADADPLRQFERWFHEARDAGLLMPETVAVATATPDGRPSVRMVLMKHYDARGFQFFTNYASRKAIELDANPHAALMFYWEQFGRSVRIEGTVARTTAEESAAYVRSRPKASQLSALASQQSRPVADRTTLERAVSDLAERYAETDPPVPAGWGGYRVTPEVYEFWQNRNDRLHDRLRYTPDPGGGWVIERLSP
jgi:pyridoxamine 5'-phosphate oxidase